MKTTMSSETKHTYDQVFQHPISHNLEWRHVQKMFEHLGEVEVEHNGNVKVTVAGHSAVFHSPSPSDIATADQVSVIRHLIKSAELEQPETGVHLLLVIDHKEAKIYLNELKDSKPETIKPLDNLGHHKHVHSAHDYSDHEEKPNHHEYFEAVAKDIEYAEKILVFGSGEGSSNTMDIFATWLKEYHPVIALKIVETVKIDLSHHSEGQLLAKAREIYGRKSS